MADHILLEVVTPDRQVLSLHASELQFRTADQGYYGILPGHTPVLTPLGNGVLRYVSGGSRHCLVVFGGFAEVGPEQVSILARTAESPETLQADVIRHHLTEAEKRLSTAGSPEELAAARSELEAANVRLEALDHQT